MLRDQEPLAQSATTPLWGGVTAGGRRTRRPHLLHRAPAFRL